MIHKFHSDSQKEMIKSVQEIKQRASSGLRHIGEIVKELNEGQNEGSSIARHKVLERINERRRLIYDRPGNEWAVYELCKDVYELAEIDRVDFIAVNWTDINGFITKLIPFESAYKTVEGVREYHDSMLRQGRKMNWLIKEERQQAEALKDEAVQLTQDMLFSFIQHKGLIKEFQDYVVAYEPSHGQAAH